MLQVSPMSEPPTNSRDFTSLYRKTVAPLRRHLARILGNPTEAQDVAHDAYVKVYPIMENQAAEKPEALLYTTARRLAFNRLKRRRIAPFVPGPPVADLSASSTPGVVQQVMARRREAFGVRSHGMKRNSLQLNRARHRAASPCSRTVGSIPASSSGGGSRPNAR